MWASILAAAISTSAPAPDTPSPPATTVSPVTVEAPVKASDLARSRSFIDSYASPTAKLDRYARWAAPPCVAVSGLAPAQAASVKARIEEIARSAGLTVGAPGCRANVEIEFTAQPQALVDQIVAKSPQVLGFQPGLDPAALKTVSRPIQAWYMTASRGGVNALAKSSAMAGAPRPSLPAPDPGTSTLARHAPPSAAAWAQTNSVLNSLGGATPGSVLSTPESLDGPGRSSGAGCEPRAPTCQSVFWNVLVVADVGKVQDHSVQSLTDYVAMLALSQPRSLDGCMALASIIDLLAPEPCPGRDAPDGLTAADSAFLTALYASDPMANKALQQSAMSARMAGDLAKTIPVAAKTQDGQ